jgi:hypothetical protein
MASAAVQQKMATAAAGTAQQEEEVEHGPFPIEQLRVRNRLAPETLLGFLALLFSCKWLLQGSRSARWSGKGDRLLAFLGILGQVLVSWPRSRGFVLTRFPPLWLQGRAFLGTSGLCAARLALICSVWCSSEFSVMMAVTGPHFLEFPVSAV